MGHVKRPKVQKQTETLFGVLGPEEGVSFSEPEFDTVAVGILKGTGSKRIVIKIPVNTKTFETGEIEIVEESDDYHIAQSTFRQTVTKNGLFS